MTCEECDKKTEIGYIRQIAFYRVGNKKIGWGNIGLVGCPAHIKLALDRLNAAVIEDIEKE